MTRQSAQVQGEGLVRSRSLLLFGLGLSILLLLLCLGASLTYGVADISPDKVYQALIAFDNSTEHLIIQTIRLPRSLVAMSVGATLAVAGALMQGLTRNPLADPSILGINAGAAFAVVTATFSLEVTSIQIYTWFAFTGAALTAIAVYLVGSLGRGGLTPLNLTLAGVVLATFLYSLTSGILILSQRTLEEIRFWLAGSVAGRDMNLFLQVLPYLLFGLLLAFVLGRQITTLSLGEDIAKGLGQSTAWVKLLAAVSIVLLAGGSVALAGPIGFIGLVVPHIARFLVGVDYRWILPYAAVFGAITLLIADIGARSLIPPTELPVGLVTPLIGTPFLIYLTRWRVKQ